MHHRTAVRTVCLAIAAAGLAACSVSRPATRGRATAGTAATPPTRRPRRPRGADGAGDPYYPKDGNGGYDVTAYHVSISYDPATKQLTGDTLVTAKAGDRAARSSTSTSTGWRSARSRSDGSKAEFTREGDHELVITPAEPVADGATFETRVKYSGTPEIGRGGHARRERLADRDVRRRVRGGRAALGDDLVPGERHPEGQGDVQAGRAGAERVERDLQRPRGRRRPRARRLDHVPLDRAEPDRHVPDDRRHRQVDVRAVARWRTARRS